MALGRRLPLVPILVLLVLALAACGGGSKTKAAPAQQTTTDAAGCRSVTPPAAKTRTESKPTKRLDQTKTYDVLIKTNCGDFTIRLAVKTSPATTASFASLARKGFFNGTVFHRIVPGFVIQGGDPTGTGTSGPGYTTVDVPPASTRYTLGVVAMAKSGAEPPGTAGSQFFVVTAQDAQLPPDYAVLGTIVKGQATVDKIGQFGDPASGGQGVPTETVEIEKATVTVH
ncbi:MAG: peptidyl-prolyl cis-trans isomerase cyclophilin type [Actinomycetia bacterium]|nr:peptidyl-prolyl cis-trans isomerase cyclophilin type [Actinomycetes bacterium]